jgi:hypothetical protein
MPILRHSQVYNFYLEAGQSLPQAIPGTYFIYLDGPGEIQVQLDEQPASSVWVGSALVPGIYHGQEQAFSMVRMRNLTAAAIRITVWIGYTDFIDRRRDQIDAPSTLVAVPDLALVYVAGVLLANQSLPLTGAPALPSHIRRKALQIANLDPGTTLKVKDVDGRIAMIVRAGETITQPISGPVSLVNDTGAGVACWVSEIWFTR